MLCEIAPQDNDIFNAKNKIEKNFVDIQPASVLWISMSVTQIPAMRANRLGKTIQLSARNLCPVAPLQQSSANVVVVLVEPQAKRVIKFCLSAADNIINSFQVFVQSILQFTQIICTARKHDLAEFTALPPKCVTFYVINAAHTIGLLAER